MYDVKAFRIETPWNEVAIPDYRTFALGKWRLRKTPVTEKALGYWFPVYDLKHSLALQKRENRVWATKTRLTPLETQSLQPHIEAAHGNVIVAGLGLGLYLYNILGKPEVKKVLACEIDPEMVKVFDRVTSWRAWPGAEKLEIRECDAKKLRLQAGADFTVDYLFVDIWDVPGTDFGHIDVQNMVNGIHPKTVSYWGQEIDFGTFLVQNKLPFSRKTSLEHWGMFRDVTGMPLAGGTWEMYPRFCGAATLLQTMESRKLSEVEKNQCFMQALAMLGALDGLGAPAAKGLATAARAAEHDSAGPPAGSV